VLTPVDVDVESAATLLFVVDTPVEADVDSDVTPLLVEESPLESEPTPL